MTTIVAVKKERKVVISADSQTSFGSIRLGYHDDAVWDKIFEVNGSYFAICGSAAHDLVLQSALKKTKNLNFSSRAAIFQSFIQLHPRLKRDFFLKPQEDDEDPYESSQMNVMIANRHGIFSVYSLREVYEYHRFWAIGSGSDFAMGAMHAVYAGTGDAITIAQIGIEAGCHFDSGSSLPISSYTLELV